MVKMCDLTLDNRNAMVEDLSMIMESYYRIDKESITEFWQTVEIGLQAREVV